MKLDAHAYLVRSGTLETVTELLKENGAEVRGNPDVYQVSSESLSVEEARAITDFASLAPLGDRKYILIETKSATPEAQTALLKTIEEGSGRSIFFLIVPVGAYILPTLQSRCVVLKSETETDHAAGKEFLAMEYKDRLALAEKFAKDHDRDSARALVRSLLSLAHIKKFDTTKLRDLLEADRYLSSSGSSVKSVLGHLALVL